MTFSKLGLCEPILKAVLEQGYTAPTPIQAKVIPEILAGRSVVASAQTGTGKTAGFVLPILERLKGERKRRAKRMRALIIEPTRELAVQVQEYSSVCETSGRGIHGDVWRRRHGAAKTAAYRGC